MENSLPVSTYILSYLCPDFDGDTDTNPFKFTLNINNT